MRTRFEIRSLVAAGAVVILPGAWSSTLLDTETVVHTTEPGATPHLITWDQGQRAGHRSIATADAVSTTTGSSTALPASGPPIDPATTVPPAPTATSYPATAGFPAPAPTPTTMPTTAPPPTAPLGGTTSAGWRITVYYTAVESFHSGATQSVTGCVGQSCSNGNSDLGTYPATFVEAVQDEGTGRITTGPNAGRYLNWSSDVGYWLDSVAASGYGVALRPFVSAAADGGALPNGARFRVVDPLQQNDGSFIESGFAAQLRNTVWDVEDQFTPGLGGAGHLDLYIGEQNQANFTSSDRFVELTNATIIRIS